MAMLPADFIYLHQVDSSIKQHIVYATNDNIIGQPLHGYKKQVCILTKQAVTALSTIQKELKEKYHYELLIFDAYRPTQAVEHFKSWSLDIQDQKNKALYYPNIDKKDFFKLGYVAEKSNHSSGSTVDLTIIDSKTGKELDMGTRFDFMDPLSHPDCRDVTKEQYQNRQLLKQIMNKYGFVGIDTEWWHFTLENQPFPGQYFNFVVE